MNKIITKIIFVFICIGIMIHCERDDICISTVEGSSDMLILMLESKTGARKSPSGFSVRAIGTEKTLPQKSFGDSLALPLQISEAVTQFEFILNEGSENQNIDTLQINYQRLDEFINRACGYRANFILDQSPVIILNSGNNWIKGAIILKDTISDETAAHLGILF